MSTSTKFERLNKILMITFLAVGLFFMLNFYDHWYKWGDDYTERNDYCFEYWDTDRCDPKAAKAWIPGLFFLITGVLGLGRWVFKKS